ncbi:MAG: ATP-binding protein [Rhodocyclales bacterium]|nr:ATP-binding protein [Rhodocyclales bacterium]
MTKDAAAAGLRAAAEARLKAVPATEPATAAASKADQLRLLHELQVHQVELEMQNEELRQSHVELEALLTRYTELYDFAPVGYLTLTADGLIAEINLTGAKLLGMERQNLLKKRFNSFVSPVDQTRWAAFFLSVKSHEDQGHEELELQRRDGTIFYAQMDCVRHRVMGSGMPGVGADGTAIFPAGTLLEVSIALTDISVRKAVEAKLNETMVAAEKANRAKTDFLSSMSHELRTPLNAILGFAQLMESGSTSPTPSQKQSLDQILKAGWYLLELINEILDLAQIESGKVMLSREPVSVDEVMHECRTMIEPQAQKRSIGLSFPQFDTPLFVNADRTRVKQILINLLFNAIKYNTPEGSVAVECKLSSPNVIRISVRDTGAGLDVLRVAQLFQPFNRLGKEAGVEEGTGIGLVVTKRLVELMGGTIGVDSAVDVGSVFWFELSRTTAPPPGSPEAAKTSPPIPPKVSAGPSLRTVLLVEDNPANQDLVEQLIERRSDLRLLSVADGNLGVEFARTHLPEVILMDINLPGISGLDALKILRADPSTARIPIIALSANAIPRDIEKALAAGFFSYLTKPIKVSEFMDTLDVALRFSADR